MPLTIVRDDPSYIPPMWGKLLAKIEGRIASSEGDGLRARWDFGRELLKQRKDKQLPPGLLDAVAKEVHASRTEITARKTFALRYPTEPELNDAVAKFPTWRQMSHEGIAVKRETPKKPTGAARLAFRRAGALADDVHFADFEEADLRAMDELMSLLTRLVDERAQKENSDAA